MRSNAVIAAAAMVAGLAACAAPPPPPPAPAPAVSADPAPTRMAGTLDGRYRAPPDGARGSARCGTTVFRYPIVVSNGVASMQTVSVGRLEGKVARDGSLVIEQGASQLRGQFSGNKFNGTYTRSGCSFTLDYAK